MNFGCKTSNEYDLKRLKELDSQKTKELIRQILKDENKGYLSSSCITEKSKAILKPMVTNSDEYVKNNLKIRDTIHYELQKQLYKQFKLTADLVLEKNILTEKQLGIFKEKSKNGDFRFWEWLQTSCEDGFCSISKPIFNETFDLAYVQIGKVCGSYCGGGEERIYEFKNGKWIEKESLGTWVS